jgi:hypothetical protein
MSIKNYIQELKTKPEAERKQFAYMATIACMVVVGGVWIYGLVGRFGSTENEVQVKNETKPMSVLADSLKDAYKNISASVGQAKSISNIMKSSPEVQTEIPDEKVIDLIPVEINSQ